MIVAAGATQGHSHEDPADRVDLFVDDVELHLSAIILSEHLRTDREEACRHLVLVVALGVGALEEVAGELGAEEFIVGLVTVEAVDDPVPVAPGLDVGDVFVQPV